MNSLTHLYPATMEPCSMVKTAYVEARQSWLCTGCGYPRPDDQAIDVSLQDSEPKGSLNFVNGCGVPLARKALLLSLGQEVISRDLYIGRVFGKNGSLLTDWVTYRGKNRLIIRGTRNVSFRRCADCGRPVYFAMGNRYLCPPPAEGCLYESDLMGLIVPAGLIERLAIAQWPSIAIDELPVMESPKDGLPIVL